MQREESKVGSFFDDGRPGASRRQALEILLQAREQLLDQLSEEILSHREAILDGPGQGGLFAFELQEIEDRYSARLHALNSILENLEYRRPRIANKVETFISRPEDLSADLEKRIQRYDQWDIVDIDVTPLDAGGLLVVIGFTADESDDGDE